MHHHELFPGIPENVGAARRFVSRHLAAHPSVDDLVLVVSELAGNAVKHSRSGQKGGLFAVYVTWERAGVRLSVLDQGADEPPVLPELVAMLSSAEQEGSRGLGLVVRLSDRSQVFVRPDGHQVTVELYSANNPRPGKNCEVASYHQLARRLSSKLHGWHPHYGEFTKHWWAMPPVGMCDGQLVEADDPEELLAKIHAAATAYTSEEAMAIPAPCESQPEQASSAPCESQPERPSPAPRARRRRRLRGPRNTGE